MVTKFFPASDVRILAELGVTDVGENRHQEAEAKAAECADLDLQWHFIGGLQSNKAAAVASYAAVVESVDRRKLVGPLSRGAHQRSHPVDVLLQVSLDPPERDRSLRRRPRRPRRAGGRRRRRRHAHAARPDGGRTPRRGPRPAFARLADVRAAFLTHHPSATWLSAGMSADLEHAIRAGATHVRVGSAVLGSRPTNQ